MIMMPPSLLYRLRPTESQIAMAYLRIAHIYRRGGLPHLALDYYQLVMARFTTLPRIARRARLFAARCLAAMGDHRAARRLLRALLRDPFTAPGLASSAALRILDLVRVAAGPQAAAQHRPTVSRRLQTRLTPARFQRWQRLAIRVGGDPVETRPRLRAIG
jgi:hypothetical protein